MVDIDYGDVTVSRDGRTWNVVSTGNVLEPYEIKSANYTLVNTDKVIEYQSGSYTATLPTAVGIKGKVFRIINSGTGTITVAPDGSETINGYSSVSLMKGEVLDVQSNDTNWNIV